MPLLFVYGTLKSDKSRGDLLKDCGEPKIGKGRGHFELFQGKGYPYPCLLLSEERNTIDGEIYNVSEEKIKELDYIEGHPFLFKRIKIDNFVFNGKGFGDTVISYFFVESNDPNFRKYAKKIDRF